VFSKRWPDCIFYHIMHLWILFCSRIFVHVFLKFTWFMVYCMATEVCFCPQLLDCALGHNESALFRRAQLKALVSIHGKEVTLSYHSASWVVFMLNQVYDSVASTMTGWQGWRAYSWWDYNHKWSLGSDWKGIYHIHNLRPIFHSIEVMLISEGNTDNISKCECTWYKAKHCYTCYLVKWLLPWYEL